MSYCPDSLYWTQELTNTYPLTKYTHQNRTHRLVSPGKYRERAALVMHDAAIIVRQSAVECVFLVNVLVTGTCE